MCQYQTLRAETWWTLLQMTFRVFSIFKKSRNSLNGSPQSSGCYFWEKKRPLPGNTRLSSEWVFTQIVDFQVWDEKIDSTPTDEMIKKMMLDIISTHWNAPNLLFYYTKVWKTRKWVKSGPWWPYLVDLRSIKLLYLLYTYIYIRC